MSGAYDDLSDLTLQERLERTLNRTRTGSCWARTIEGEALQYLRGIEEADPLSVYQALASAVFKDYGYDVSEGQVGTHIHKKCKCRG